MAVKKVLQENVVRGNQAGRIVETTDGKKVFLVGNTRGETGGGSGGDRGGGGEAAAEGELRDYAAESRAAQEALLAAQNAREDAAIGAFGQRISGMERPEAIYSRLEAEKGIPEIQARTKAIRQRIADVEGLLGQLPENITQRVAGTLTTAAQRNRILAKEQAPLAGQISEGARELGVESGNLSEAQAGVANLTGLTIQGQQAELEPERMRISMMSDRAARELTAFTSNRELELDRLGDKLQRTRQLSDQEWARANELADQSTQYERLRDELIQRSTLAKDEAKYGSQLNREEAAYSMGLDLDKARQLEALKVRTGGGGGGSGSNAPSEAVAYYTDQVVSGKLSLENVPAASGVRNAVAAQLSRQSATQETSPITNMSNTTPVAPRPSLKGWFKNLGDDNSWWR